MPGTAGMATVVACTARSWTSREAASVSAAWQRRASRVCQPSWAYPQPFIGPHVRPTYGAVATAMWWGVSYARSSSPLPPFWSCTPCAPRLCLGTFSPQSQACYAPGHGGKPTDTLAHASTHGTNLLQLPPQAVCVSQAVSRHGMRPMQGVQHLLDDAPVLPRTSKRRPAGGRNAGRLWCGYHFTRRLAGFGAILAG